MARKSRETSRMASRVEIWPLYRLSEYDRNPRTHSAAQVAQIAASIIEFGFTAPILVDEKSGMILAGHGRLAAARKLGMPEVPVVPLGYMTEAQRRAYVIADNRLALNAGWDDELLAAELAALQGVDFDLGVLGFTDDELAGLMPPGEGAGIGAGTGAGGDDNGEDEIPAPPAVAHTRPGQVWQLGRHRIMCGDSTVPAHVERLRAGMAVDVVCTDPPYCSGGFQETEKSPGSVGTNATHKQVANDTLSTRGYMALLKSAFIEFGAPFLYSFTDWRMWTYLFDVAESSGYGVRSMIVWNKGTAGMGRGWRAQHELILWACRSTPPYPKDYGGRGNVIEAKRSGNAHHTTEKPVDLIEQLIGNLPFVKVVGDPFAGSGTTLIACEKLDRVFLGMELDPLYCDVAVRRWQRLTGARAIDADTGAEYPEAPITDSNSNSSA